MKVSDSFALTAFALSVSLAVTLVSAPYAKSQSSEQSGLSDKAINADYETFERQQAAIKALNDSGNHSVSSASLAKAQCWLDVSFHEYSRNDRSAFPPAALAQSIRITEFLQNGGNPTDLSNPAITTPLVNEAAKLRNDLWNESESIKSGPGGHCVAADLACAQVELVHAGNEYNQLGWRHAKPYVQLAEDRLVRAGVAAQECAAVVAKPIERPVTPAPTPAPAPVQELTLISNVLFNFDRDTIDQARRVSIEQLDALLARINSDELSPVSIRVIGHADLTQNPAQPDYNQGLSLRRANAVAAHIISAGIAAELISVESRSDREQSQQCAGINANQTELIECLLPNRRVEVSVTATRPAR